MPNSETYTSVWWVSDGDGQSSCHIVAETAEAAQDKWDEDYNPFGLEVFGKPWRDGSATLMNNIYAVPSGHVDEYNFVFCDESQTMSQEYETIEDVVEGLRSYVKYLHEGPS